MTIAPALRANVLWFLPTHGDGHRLGSTIGARPVSINYLRQIAQAADDLGYFGALRPTDLLIYQLTYDPMACS